jgi:hypothetical protein
VEYIEQHRKACAFCKVPVSHLQEELIFQIRHHEPNPETRENGPEIA